MRNGCVGVWLALAVLFGPRTSVAQETTRTNFELVRDAARAACTQLVGKLPSDARSGALAIRSVGAHDGAFLVENALATVLAEAGMGVRTRPDSLGPVLEFEVVDLGVSYTRTWRHAWLGERRVEREGRARLFARLVDQDDSSILWGEQAESKLTDEIAQKSLSALEEKGNAEYLKATLPPQGWNRYVEPVVVTGIVVGLIALFFSNQDASN